MIKLEHVKKSYIDTDAQLNKPIWTRLFSSKTKKNVIHDLSFTIQQGEIVGYIGENGAGKSTTIKMILGIIPCDAGDIDVLHHNPFKNRKKNALKIGVLFGQKSHLWWDLPLIDSFKFLQKVYKKNSVDDAAWLAWLIKALEVDSYVEQPVRELSLGQRMRAEFICAILHSPELVILDEPTIGLDVKTKQKMMEMILEINQSKGTTFLITSHDFQEIEKVCHRIIMLNDGRNVYDGTVLDYKNDYDFYRKVIVASSEEINMDGLELLTSNVSSKEYYFDARLLSEETVMTYMAQRFSRDVFHFSSLSFAEIIIVKSKENESCIK